jgi:predicted amidohydrolase
MQISVIQMNSRADKSENLRIAEHLINEAARSAPDLIVLPEYFAHLGDNRDDSRSAAELFGEGEAWKMISSLAVRNRVTVHAGSMMERAGNSYFNATAVFDPQGRQIAHYRKLHLFDVDVPGGLVYRESDNVSRGEAVVTYKVGDVTVGCSICYDLRFPELFRALRDAGAQVIVLPAAFTLMTGKDHWEVLLRARAIETQCFVAASAQIFGHGQNGQKVCYGHSMVIDPWGMVVAQVPDRVGHAAASIDLDQLADIRTKLPVANHHILPL